MKNVKVCELRGVALDWAVAKCEGYTDLRKNPHRFANDMLVMTAPRAEFGAVYLCDLDYSTSWELAGPIVEREQILLRPIRKDGHKFDGQWLAKYDCGNTGSMVQWVDKYCVPRSYRSGPTPLIAAMRCYVASKLGDCVEIPEELSE